MTERFYIKDEVDENGEKKDLGVYESRRLTTPDSYDDNWNLASYTSEVRKEKDDSFYAFIDFNGDEGSIRECPRCLEFDFHEKLYPKILKNGERPSPDDENFVSCHNCGNTFPIYQAHYESQIKDNLETVSNPFESNESIFLTTESRSTQRKKRERKDKYRKGVHKYRSKRIDYEEQEDPDRSGSDTVRIIR